MQFGQLNQIHFLTPLKYPMQTKTDKLFNKTF